MPLARHILASPRLWRVSLALYTLALLTATHWPRLTIDGPVARSDLYLHIAAFEVLGMLLALAGLFGPAGSFRNAWRSWLAGVAFAGLDELTQAIPGLGRTAGWDDWAADVAGLTIGVAVGGVLARLLKAVKDPRQP